MAIRLSIKEGPPVSDGLAVGGALTTDGEPPGIALVVLHKSESENRPRACPPLFYISLAPLDAVIPRSRGFGAAVFGPAFTPGSQTAQLDSLPAPFTGLPEWLKPDDW